LGILLIEKGHCFALIGESGNWGCLVVREELEVEGGTWIWEGYFGLLLLFVI
jgi:hypothetical protein